jgi:tetratricopeptide (TPR) repeat protein
MQSLLQRTEGNPFFLEESIQTLVETQVLVGERSAYRVAKPLQSIQVPATVQAVLAARVDRLPPQEKRLLQTAAVVGMEVPFALVQAVAELPEEELRHGLAHLQATEFLYETRLFPDRVYTFKHALTHEVAYNNVFQERRRALHARIVEALEALAGDQVAEQVERLAHHALRGEVWDKAVTCCQQAGARAYDRAAFREAVAYFDQALQALAHLREPGDTMVLAIELRLTLGGALRVLGEYGRCLALLGEAEALARALDDRAQLGRVLAGMTGVLRVTGDHDGAMAAAQQALDLAAELGDRALQVQASYNLGTAYQAIGDFGRAAELLRRNVEAADRESGTPGTDWRIVSRAWLALILSHLGAFAEGRRHGEEALRLATLEGRGAIPIVAHGCLGNLYLAKGDLEHAIRMLDQSLALCRASGNLDWLRRTVAGLGYAYALQGRLAEGGALVEEAISESIRTGARQNQSRWVAWLSEVCRLAGRGDEAWQHARQALDLARRQKERGNEALALCQLGAVYAQADPPDVAQAETHYQQALALAEELGMRPLIAHCHRGLGTLYAEIGRHEPARAELSIAIELYRAMDMTFWLPQAEAALARTL